MSKEKYIKKFLNLTEEFITDIEPAVKKAGGKVMDFAKEVANEELEKLISKGKEKIKSKSGKK
jgi:hypothetical protein